jgi:hypothetical protein
MHESAERPLFDALAIVGALEGPTIESYERAMALIRERERDYADHRVVAAGIALLARNLVHLLATQTDRTEQEVLDALAESTRIAAEAIETEAADPDAEVARS